MASSIVLSRSLRHLWSPQRLTVRVSLDGQELASRDLSRPFARIGSSPGCDVVVAHPRMPRKALYVHATEGGISCLSLSPWRRSATKRIGAEGRILLRPFQLVVRGQGDYSPDSESALLRQWPIIVGRSTVTEERKKFRLQRTLTLIGRAPTCQLHLRDESVSKFHSVLFWDGALVWVVDLDSREGTRVNGSPVVSSPLQPGDVLEVGNYRFVWEGRTAPSSGLGGVSPIGGVSLGRTATEAISGLLAHDASPDSSATFASTPNGIPAGSPDVAEDLTFSPTWESAALPVEAVRNSESAVQHELAPQAERDGASAELQSRVAALETSLAEARLQESVLADHLHRVQAENADALALADERVQDLEQALEHVQASHTEIKDALAARDEELQELRRSLTDQGHECQQLRDQVTTFGETQGRARAALSEREAEFNQQLAEARQRETEVRDQLQRERLDQERARSEAARREQDLEQSAQRLQGTVAELRTSLATETADLETALENLAQRDAECRNLCEQLATSHDAQTRSGAIQSQGETKLSKELDEARRRVTDLVDQIECERLANSEALSLANRQEQEMAQAAERLRASVAELEAARIASQAELDEVRTNLSERDDECRDLREQLVASRDAQTRSGAIQSQRETKLSAELDEARGRTTDLAGQLERERQAKADALSLVMREQQEFDQAAEQLRASIVELEASGIAAQVELDDARTKLAARDSECRDLRGELAKSRGLEREAVQRHGDREADLARRLAEATTACELARVEARDLVLQLQRSGEAADRWRQEVQVQAQSLDEMGQDRDRWASNARRTQAELEKTRAALVALQAGKALSDEARIKAERRVSDSEQRAAEAAASMDALAADFARQSNDLKNQMAATRSASDGRIVAMEGDLRHARESAQRAESDLAAALSRVADQENALAVRLEQFQALQDQIERLTAMVKTADEARRVERLQWESTLDEARQRSEGDRAQLDNELRSLQERLQGRHEDDHLRSRRNRDRIRSVVRAARHWQRQSQSLARPVSEGAGAVALSPPAKAWSAAMDHGGPEEVRPDGFRPPRPANGTDQAANPMDRLIEIRARGSRRRRLYRTIALAALVTTVLTAAAGACWQWADELLGGSLR